MGRQRGAFARSGTDLSTYTRAELERAVRQAQARARALIDQAPEPTVLFDPQTGCFVDANAAAARLFDLPRAELLERGPARMSPAFQPGGRSSEDASAAHIGAALAGEPQEFDWMHVDGHGNPLPCRVQLLRLPVDNAFIVRGAMTDLRDVQALESALANERHINTRLLHAIPGSLHVHDLAYERVMPVPTGPDAPPIDLRELENAAPFSPHGGAERVHPDDWVNVRLGLYEKLAVLEDGEDVTVRMRVKQADDSYRWTRTVTTVFSRHADGTPALFLTQAQDDQDRADMQSELEEQRRFNERLLGTIPGAVHIFDMRSGAITYATRSLGTALGYTPDERAGIVQTPLASLVHPDDRASTIEHLQELPSLADGEVRGRRMRLLHADGSTRWFETWDTPFQRDADGEVTHVLGLAQDVTEYHLAERDAQMRELTDQLDVGVFEVHIKDGVFQVVRSNAVYKRMLGETAQDPSAFEAHLAQFHPDDRQGVLDAFSDVLKGPGSYTSKPLRHRLNEERPYRWLQWHQAVEVGADGVVTRGFVSDVTKKVEDEAELERLQAQFKSVLDHLPVPVVLSERGGARRYINTTFEEVFGYAFEDVPTLGAFIEQAAVDEAHAQSLRADARELIRRAEQTGQSEVLANVKLVPKDASAALLMEAHYRVLEPDTGLAIAAYVDVTAREEQARAQQARMDEVEKLNSELDASNRELEAFSYSVSHDLRAPLRHIDAFGAALVEDCEDLEPLAKDYLARIRASSQRMGRLIDDLLKLSKVGRAEMTVLDVDVSAMARTITERLHKGDETRDIEWSIAEGLRCHVDPALFRLALENLLENAWKYTAKEAAARVALTGRVVDGGLELVLADNGVGFDQTYADKLFQPFQRLHSDRSFSGTGIGLATVRRIVERHHGRVDGQGVPGQGATFTVFIPAAVEAS